MHPSRASFCNRTARATEKHPPWSKQRSSALRIFGSLSRCSKRMIGSRIHRIFANRLGRNDRGAANRGFESHPARCKSGSNPFYFGVDPTTPGSELESVEGCDEFRV